MSDQATEQLGKVSEYQMHERLDGKGPQCCDLCESETATALFRYERMEWVAVEKQEPQGVASTFLCQLCGDNPKLCEIWLHSKGYGPSREDRPIIEHCAVANASLNLALNQINDMFLDHLETLR